MDRGAAADRVDQGHQARFERELDGRAPGQHVDGGGAQVDVGESDQGQQVGSSIRWTCSRQSTIGAMQRRCRHAPARRLKDLPAAGVAALDAAIALPPPRTTTRPRRADPGADDSSPLLRAVTYPPLTVIPTPLSIRAGSLHAIWTRTTLHSDCASLDMPGGGSGTPSGTRSCILDYRDRPVSHQHICAARLLRSLHVSAL